MSTTRTTFTPPVVLAAPTEEILDRIKADEENQKKRAALQAARQAALQQKELKRAEREAGRPARVLAYQEAQEVLRRAAEIKKKLTPRELQELAMKAKEARARASSTKKKWKTQSQIAANKTAKAWKSRAKCVS